MPEQTAETQVLIVDDDAIMGELLDALLTVEGYRVTRALSGEEALQVAREGTRKPSVILCDIQMPGMSGLEMLPKVRAERPDVPVIMITAYGDAETRRKAIERGAIGLLTKPIDFALLRHEIDTRLAA